MVSYIDSVHTYRDMRKAYSTYSYLRWAWWYLQVPTYIGVLLQAYATYGGYLGLHSNSLFFS
jgi:hypothetical protein